MKRQEFVRRGCRGVLSAMACVALATGVARAGDFDAEVNGNSLVVTTSEDVVDPDDGLVSLREAIAYGLDHYKECASPGFITPEFSVSAFKDGDVRLVLNRAITLDMCEAFENGYTVWIKPGVGQRLTLSTDPLCGGGIFRQAEGTRLRVDDVLFTDCSNFEGSGGVLDSDGRTRFNRCRFENCFAAEVRIIPAARALSDAYKPVFDMLALSNGAARAAVLRSIPPDRRWNFTNDTEKAVSGALAACSNTVRVLQNAYLSFDERLAGANACLTNFLAVTKNVTGPFNVFCLYSPTIAMRLNAEGIYVNAELLSTSLASARASLREFESIRKSLTESNGAIAVAGSGGAINLREKGECIVYDASVRGCGTFGDGGFLANRGDFKGVNLTLTGNNAIEGGCICNLAGTNQLAGVAIVDNVSETNGAVLVRGGAIGFLNSIVIANEGGSVAAAQGVTVTNVHSLVEGDTPIAKSDVFASTAALEGGDTNHLAQLYYPLKPNGPASHTGTFVFFNCETDKAQADGLDSEWIKNILHTTAPDGFNPDAQWLFGSGVPRLNASLLYDLLGQPIRTWENKETFEGPIAASMGPVPNVPPETAGLIVTTFDDEVSTVDNMTSLREAAASAMAMSTDRVVCVSFASAGIYELKNQIVVPSGKTLCIAADPGAVTLKPAKAYGNRFFRVERGGRLLLSGLVMDGGYAKGEYAVGTGPANDDNGGAICSEGELVLSDCTVQQCKANGFGGAVWSSGGMTAVRCAFTENFAQCGGGICSYDEPLRLSGVSITDNTAQDYGGGLYLVTGPNDVTATGATITGNTANGETVQTGPNRGGGVYLTANMSACPGTVTISGTVSGNTGGNDSRDGGTEPVSPVQTSETPDKEGTPIQPPRRLLSAVNALAATPALAATSDGAPLCEINGVQFDSVEKALESAKPGETVRLITAARAGELHIPDFVTLDLNGFSLTRHDIRQDNPGWQKLPDVVENGGVLVAYNRAEVDALFDGTFIGTMRFGRAVDWSRTGNSGETLTFPQGTDVTVGTGSGKTDVYLVTTTFIDTYGLPDDWAVDVYGSTELGGLNYRKCSLEVAEDAHVVTPMKLVDSTLAVSGTVSFAEGAYIELGSLTNSGIYARNRIDFRHLRFSDPSQADVICTELPDGTYWYHPGTEALSLVAEVDFERYTLRDAFAVANGNGHAVTLLRDDADDAGTISVGRSIAFDMNGRRICGAGGTNLTFSVSNGGFAVSGCGSEGCTDVTFQLGRGRDFDGSLILSGGSFAVAKGPAVAVDAACTNAAVVLTDGAKLLASAAVSEIVRLDGIADCLFDNATVRGDSATNAIVHHSARIVVTNGAALVSKGVTIRQTASGACPAYNFTLEMSGTNSLVRTLEGAHCVASELTPGDVKSKSAANRFTCTSGDFECPKSEENAAVAFFGDFEYDVTGGRFGGSVAPPASPKFAATEVEVPDRGLYWEVIRLGEEGVYVAKAGDELYESLEEAFERLAPGGVVTMLADVGFRTSVAVDRPATLDLNGFHLSGRLIEVARGSALTIVDTIGSGEAEEVQFAVSGTLMVKAGTFVACEIGGDGTLEFLGGAFYGKMPDDKDKYLAADYKWEYRESAPCWTPVKEAPQPPSANDGVRIEDGKVFRGDYEITGAVTVRSDGSVELNPGGSVGGVRVTPVIGDLPPGDGDETEPFAVGEGSVSLTVQTIPGLTYVLLRGETPDQVDKPVASSMATKNVMTLEDFDKPKDGAFYQIKVLLD